MTIKVQANARVDASPTRSSTDKPIPPITPQEAPILGTAGCSIPQTEDRGIRLRQLKLVFERACTLCAQQKWTSSDPKKPNERLTKNTINLYDMTSRFIVPQTRKRGCSLVELVAAGPQPPDFFVSHWWGEPVADFIRCLEQHANDRGLGEDTTYWVCAYANNQHNVASEMGGDDIKESSFYRALIKAQGTVVVLDRAGIVYTRVWCGYEQWLSLIEAGKKYDAYTRLEDGSAVGIADGITAADEESGKDTYRGAPAAKLTRERRFPSALVKKAHEFDISSAQTSSEDDKTRILAAITDKASLNATVAASLGAVPLSRLISLRARPEELEIYLGAMRRSQLRGLAISTDPTAQLAEVFQAHGACRALSVLFTQTVGSTAGLASALTNALPASLTRLELIAVPLSFVHCAQKALATGALTDLTLARIGLTADKVGKLAEALGDRGGLQNVDLSGNGFGDRGTAHLAQALRQCVAMHTLSLQGNRITSIGATALAGALEPMGMLQHLKLDGNSIGDEGVRAICSKLHGKGRLHTLRMGNNCVKDAGAHAIASTLAALPALKHLSLGSNLIGNDGAQALAAKLGADGPPVAVVAINGNLISDAGAGAIVNALRANPTARSLDLDMNWMSKAQMLLTGSDVGSRDLDVKLNNQKWSQYSVLFVVGVMWFFALYALGSLLGGLGKGHDGNWLALRAATAIMTCAVATILSCYVSNGLLLRYLGNGAFTFHALSGWREYACGTVMIVLFFVSVGLIFAITDDL